MVGGGEGISCVDASERAGLHTIFATGAASTTVRACAMYCFVLSFLSSSVVITIGLYCAIYCFVVIRFLR